jgi:tetratricopeptide (TPR) repeat protein
VCTLLSAIPGVGQTLRKRPVLDSDFKISLPVHPGQLQWHADGFEIIETSAKPNGQEMGVRGANGSQGLSFLGFVYLLGGASPLKSAACRDGILGELVKNPRLKILANSEIERPDNMPEELVTYSLQGSDRKTWYSVRGFVGKSDLCGDLEFYSEAAISAEDRGLRKTFESYYLDPSYVPLFKDTFVYAQILFQHKMYGAAAPIFEQALTKLGDDKTQQTRRRLTIDQAGISYGMSGDIPKARALFEAAIANDPDYPMYYYNLACADAEEKDLPDARIHLQQAFIRKANMIPAENFPDPEKDDSFLPFRKNQDFWTFLEGLH